MALAAKLLVGALVLGAGSTATYVAVTGGFGAGGNGAESEASGETKAVASPAPSSSGPQTNPVAGQGQPAAPAGEQPHNAGANTNDQVPDTGEIAQSQSDVTGEDSRAEQPQIAAVESGVNVPGQGATADVEQAAERNSAQSLPATSNNAEDGKSQGVDGGLVANTVVSSLSTDPVVNGGGNIDSDQDPKQGVETSVEPDNKSTERVQMPESQAHLEGQAPQGGSTNGQEVASPGVTGQESNPSGKTVQAN